MFIVSFYSFKGGVGRTVALLNTAWHLASRGSRVALIDLDLEAPGLQSARLRRSSRESRTGWSPPSPEKGLCDLVVHFAASNAIEDWPSGYLTEGLGPDGRMALIAARGEAKGLSIGEYEAFVQTFSWARFYQDMNGRGFMEGLVEAIAGRGYDYLFIDARTGLTDVAGISLLHLPDLVVLLTNLSDQSVQGIKTQLDSILSVNAECHGSQGSLRRRAGRQRTPIATLLVGSTLPRGELRARQDRLKMVETTLGTPLDVLIDYLPLLALEEDNHILAQTFEGRRDEMLLGSNRPYERLVEEIVARNPASPENLLIVGEELNQIGRWREALAHFDEVQDRYRERQPGILWEATLHKMATQIQALDARAAKQSLDWLEQKNRGRTHDRWEETSQIVRGRLALSRVYVTLNQFKEARDQAHKAYGMLQEGGKEPRERGHEHRSLKAACLFSLGQTQGLCGDWEDACSTLYSAAETYRNLGTRPLLECLTFSELARARLLTGQLSLAQETLAWARARTTSAEHGSSEIVANRSTSAIKSTYVQARLLQAEAEILVEQGRGCSAIGSLLNAFRFFEKDGDGVGLVEIAASIAAYDVTLLKLDKKPSQHLFWARWREEANRLGMQRTAARLDLLRSMRSLASSLGKPRIFRGKKGLPHSIRWMFSLDHACRLLGAGQPVSEIHEILEQVRREIDERPKLYREVKHELALSGSLLEIAEDDRPKALPFLLSYAEDLKNRGFRAREAQVRFVLALADPGSSSRRSDLTGTLSQLEQPGQWLWNLPVAFVRHTGYFKSRWESLEPLLEGAWPMPLESTPESTAGSSGRGGQARTKGSRDRSRA